MMKPKCSWVFLLLLMGILTVLGCQSRKESKSQVPSVKVSLALAPSQYSGLIAVADTKGFFKNCGLEVLEKKYPSGLAAVKALEKGEVQMATGADFVLATKIYDDPSLLVVASIGSSSGSEIVARQDRNIHKLSDLKGKKIGFSRGTTSEYYLDAFLLANSIPFHEGSLVNIPPERIVDAIVNGDVDAISSWESYIFLAKKGLGKRAISWPVQNYLDYYWLLIVKEEMTRNPEPMKRFLKALLMAENFLLTNENEVKDIISRKWDYDPEFLIAVWGKTRLTVSLNQSLITSLENFAQWKMRKEGRSEELPNFLKNIYSTALVEIDTKTVTLFR